MTPHAPTGRITILNILCCKSIVVAVQKYFPVAQRAGMDPQIQLECSLSYWNLQLVLRVRNCHHFAKPFGWVYFLSNPHVCPLDCQSVSSLLVVMGPSRDCQQCCLESLDLMEPSAPDSGPHFLSLLNPPDLRHLVRNKRQGGPGRKWHTTDSVNRRSRRCSFLVEKHLAIP